MIKRPENLFAEYHVVVADFSRPEKLEIWTPTQSAYLFQHSFANAFKMSAELSFEPSLTNTISKS